MPNSIFRKVPVQIQNRSGHNCSHTNSFSAKTGTLMPVLCDPVIPNTSFDLDVACEVQLPPAVSDFYGNIEARLELFFVPYRILWGGWKYFMTNYNSLNTPPSQASIKVKYLPGLSVNANKVGAGSLADMLGYKCTTNINTTVSINNALPFLSYQMVYDNWYRDSRITTPIFLPFSYNDSSTNLWNNAPHISLNSVSYAGNKQYFTTDIDGLVTLRQRCWDRDYFTNATLQPQAGSAASLQFEAVGGNTVDENDGMLHLDSSFSISALRAANSLQQFEERNNLAGQRYADQIYARFGCYPADAVTDRPIYLGSKRFNIYKRSVYQQNTAEQTSSNPFEGLLANKATSLGGFGNGKLGQFTATEHGFVFVMFSLVPQAVYSTGVRRYLNYNTLTDFPDPLLQGVGDQPIYQEELKGNNVSGVFTQDIFGYTQRYAESKFMNDEVHGLLRDGQNLAAFQMQRTFEDNQSLGTSFIEIPTNYLDQVTNVDASVSDFGCWCQCYFDYKKVMPLAAYSLPTLGDPKDTHTEVINNGGQRL